MGYEHWPAQMPETACPNCKRPMRGGMGSSEWNHGAMVCSPACGKRLHQKIACGMEDGEKHQGIRGYFTAAPDDSGRVKAMRERIKLLERRLRVAAR